MNYIRLFIGGKNMPTIKEMREMPVRVSNTFCQKTRYLPEEYKENNSVGVYDIALYHKARHILTAKQDDIITYLLSMVKPEDKPDTIYRFSIIEFCKVVGIDYTNGWQYQAIRRELQSLDSKVVWYRKENGKDARARWFNVLEIDRGGGVIEISFHYTMRPFIFGLEDNFTQFTASYKYTLEGKYSRSLYSFLKSSEGLRSRTISIEDFLEFICPCPYTEYANIRQRVLEPAIAEINAVTDIKVSVMPHKYKGSRKYNYLVFSIEPITNMLDEWDRELMRESIFKEREARNRTQNPPEDTPF